MSLWGKKKFVSAIFIFLIHNKGKKEICFVK